MHAYSLLQRNIVALFAHSTARSSFWEEQEVIWNGGIMLFHLENVKIDFLPRDKGSKHLIKRRPQELLISLTNEQTRANIATN
jgi:hypothetical protein